jgi:Domain of unknown function (DUF4276)
MSFQIACVVEGDGDAAAVPILLRRICGELFPATYLDVARPPIRVPRYQLVKPDELERVVRLAAMRCSGRGATFVLFDSDDDCPAELGPRLAKLAEAASPNVPVAVVLCKREYEAWFLAAAASLSGRRGLAANLAPPADPELIRNAKGWLSDQMSKGRKYRAILDQPALTGVFDLSQARSADSFDKCYREVQRLLTILHSRQGGASTP